MGCVCTEMQEYGVIAVYDTYGCVHMCNEVCVYVHMEMHVDSYVHIETHLHFSAQSSAFLGYHVPGPLSKSLVSTLKQMV